MVVMQWVILSLAKSFAKDIGLLKEVGILIPLVVHGGGPQIGRNVKK